MRATMMVLLSVFAIFAAQNTANATCQTAGHDIAYKVNKMHCANCEQSLVEYFSKLPNVTKASADYKQGCLKVEWKDGKEMKSPEIAAAIQKLGYEYAATTK